MKTLSDNETMKFTVSRQSGPGETRRGLLLRVCVLLLMLTGLLGMARSVLGLHSTAGWCVGLLCGMAAGTCLLLALTGQSGPRWWALLVPAAVLVLCLVCRNRVVPAAAQMTNRVLAQMQLRRQTTILPLTAEGGNPLFGIGAVSAAAGLLLALAAQFAGGFGTLLLIPLWLAAGTGYLQTDVWLALFSLGCILLPLTRRSGKKAGMQTAALTAALLALCAAAVLGFGVNGKLDPLPLRRSVSDAVHALRYEAGAQPLTEGRLDTGKAPVRSGASMLELRRSDPEAMYLRGMTGAGYSDAGWAPLSGETLSGEADRLYWLSENGFSATTQLSVLANALELEEAPVEATVTVTGACREYLYLPAGLTDCESLDPASLRDGTAAAPGLRGAQTYSFTALPALPAGTDELLEQLETHQAEPAVSEYLRLEENYREFVYANYLSVPADCDALLQTLPEMQVQPATSYEARMLIRSVLEERASYAPGARMNGGGAGLLQNILGGKQANSAQYATAAVLMLRTLGIPARYAEGYVVLPGDDAETVTLTGKDAHVWAEYYEDGIGWLPFETVPDYVEQTDEAGWPRFRTDSNALLKTQSEELPEEEQPEPPPETTPQDSASAQWEQRETTKPEQERKERILPLRLLLVLPALLLTVVLWLLLRRRKILRARQAEFDSADLPTAICALFAHSMELMRHAGFDAGNVPLSAQENAAEAWFGTDSAFRQMRLMNEEALFSDHGFTETQRSAMRAYAAQTLEKFRGKLSRTQRLYQRWICCMY